MNRIFKIGIIYLILSLILESSSLLLGALPPSVTIYFGQYITILFPVIIIAFAFKVDKYRFKLKSFKLTTIPYLLVIFLAALPINGFLGSLTTFIFGENPNGIMAFTESLTVLPHQELFIMALTPAICEEMMFRGLLLDKKSGLNMHGLALLSGLMFSLFHVGYDQLIYTFALGVIFAYAAIISGSIFPAMILHFLNNGFGTILTMIIGPVEATEPVVNEVVTLASLLPWFLAALLGGTIIVFVYRKLISLYDYDDKRRLEANKDDLDLLNTEPKFITYTPQTVMFLYVIIANLI
ncbi:CPBP family intramembrane metalloprotease [Acidaminobacter sp. JC074]|uniref:type II CAAX endopeptidase family protein n=1 Tax=Acidaminobacter sp. JC074 TaxID=2530199 RepID=UPI001F0DD428|nr:type II CAAX endopeptidase family protein [Acidaminobacter sp. JC074]MCH4886375.1 CPBP family intramembrane metalloprotease [Acidaminobacter sp. JC074]